MYINPKSKIAGQPAIKIRNFLRRAGNLNLQWSMHFLKEQLKIPLEEAKTVLSKLVEKGYVKSGSHYSGGKYWETTLKGNALGLASAAKPIRRSTADRKLKEFLERVAKTNENKYYLYKVKKVVAFGSYLSKKETLNDIDIGIYLEPKEKDNGKHQRLCDIKIRDAIRQGRRFSNIVNELYWPLLEVLYFLKFHSRSIKLHHEDPILKKVKTKVIFEAP